MVLRLAYAGIPPALCAMLVGCRPTKGTVGVLDVASKDQFIAIAAEYIKVHRPDWAEELVGKPRVRDKGDYWEVEFHSFPEGAAGGGPAVLIDKKTGKPFKAIHYQ